jgi:hypothetical protein
MRFGPSSKTRNQEDYLGNQTAKSAFGVIAKERRIAPRYDELARYFLSAPCLTAMLTYLL